MKVVLAVHGGAGRRAVNQETYVTIKNVLEQALLEGFRVYKSGSSLDMVVAAIEVLENSGIFNAGIGSTVDASGSISMDAGLMFRGKAGAVAC
ncbi:MAG: isoaspartyl peptidase/L-asparaginase, partial [Desulfurococcaceae archaeon]|nr:isoaspartyl peptidase/L-asparaginase [Desulfurococcaceae archaeon]